MPDAAYFRAWRAAHPEYRALQRIRRNEHRRLHGRGDRSREYANRPSRAMAPVEPMPTLFQGHCVFDEARAIVGENRSGLTTLYDPLWDDLVATAVLALLEHKDAREAVRAYRSRELSIGRRTAPLIEEIARE